MQLLDTDFKKECDAVRKNWLISPYNYYVVFWLGWCIMEKHYTPFCKKYTYFWYMHACSFETAVTGILDIN